MLRTAAAPTTDDVRELSADDAQRLWIGVLARQGLAGGAKLASASEVADRVLGLHAARLPSPYATLVARLADPAAADAIFEPRTGGPAHEGHQPQCQCGLLTTVRCMRKTLHTLPLPLAAMAHAATRHFRERDALRAAHNAGIAAAQLAELVNHLVRLLTVFGPLGSREVEAWLVSVRWPVPAVRAALKVAWERGELTYLNRAQHWNREDRAFGATAVLFPQLVQGGDPRRAVELLIHSYFDRYGPASVRDAVWWSGLTQAHVLAALKSSDRHVIGLKTPWSTSPLYMYADAFLNANNIGVHGSTLDFLAHEDVALKAYFETRGRYMGSWPQRQAFNQIGEVLPTILVDGQVIGSWSWDKLDRRVTWEPFGRISSTERRHCLARATVLTAVLRSRYDDRQPSRSSQP